MVGPIQDDRTGPTDGGNTVAVDPATVPVAVEARIGSSGPVAVKADVTRSGPFAVPLNPRRPGPLLAPNGYEWPRAAGYLRGYELLRSGGLSSVTVDNGANDTRMFVKLVAVNSAAGATVVRHVFIPAYGSFTMAGVSAGTYDVRYMNLWDSSLVGTEPFTLGETHVTMTLYKVPDGNLRTHALRSDQF